METGSEDAALVSRVLSGEIEAFRGFVDRYSDAIYRFCAGRLGDQEDAEDAVQDVFVRAFRSLRSFDPTRSFRSWIFAIAANRVRSRYKARAALPRFARVADGEDALDELADRARRGPEELALDVLDAEALRAALGALPAERRVPVELYYFGGLQVAEVAECLGIGAEAVKSRLFRARKELAALLEKRPQPESPARGRGGI
ncbi:MAG: sigma-70 family RNA polymerase sigma factor [Spirochaetales bacterium]|nr:sigma-70 family RNA polymerase sigma factor [Spirochaetales bacterium]